MNANELADALETMTTGWFDDLTLTQSATMLRQQQAEIEKLKVEKIRAYDNGFEDGRKPDTNPKSAKTLTDEVYFCSRCGKRLGDGIHTCTPPADILRKAQEK